MAQSFRVINQTLADRGLFLKACTLVDASLIAAPTSTKKQDKARDPEMHASKKSNPWFFGSKFHIGVDSETGLVHSLKVTSGNVCVFRLKPPVVLIAKPPPIPIQTLPNFECLGSAKSGQIDVVIECTLPKQQQSLAIFCQQILGNIAKLF